MLLNEKWEEYLKSKGAEFVRFVDISPLPEKLTGDYTCAVLFGKGLSKEYIRLLKSGRTPERDEFVRAENKMDALAVKLAKALTADGYDSVTGIKRNRLPHKTVARIGGFGFIGKSTLLVNEDYGCAAVLGKVLTAAPFEVAHAEPMESQCGDCGVCVDTCPEKALSGKPWSLETSRDEMLNRKLCTICLKCLLNCPYTERYAAGGAET